MTEFTNTPDNGTGFSIDDAAAEITAMWDSAIEGDSVTTDDVIVDDNTASETADEIANDQPETESETNEEVAEDTNTEEGPEFELTDDYELTLDDGSKVNYAEMKKGYLRQADYTRKTQELAVEREKLGTMEQAKVDIRKQSLGEIEHIKRQLAVKYNYDFNINWQQLAQDDPYEYAQKKEAFASFEQNVQQLQQLETAFKAENDRVEQETFLANQHRARTELVEKYPEFAYKETATPILKGMTNFLKDQGFTKQEIEGIADSRILSVLYAAYKAQTTAQAVPQAKAAIAAKPKITKPSAKPHGNSRVEQSRNKFEQTGSIDDAAALIMQML
ncbi:hypothetical protein AGRHK599_LOCUS1291 [Rhizobium rhizogenes]|uniref:Scaffolding protein n=1 Tax=Rhizobium rhizogenes TaxID=359 RepID=A0AAN2DCH5_RHIRH|nr:MULTISPECIES: hypothetical protein [Rhizobium/Agrobacterium group]AQS61715.1 hypothetical protein B0909_05220 [Rhizobium rhizogenes]MCZ7443062.1 hypothetical protein [Rhizobium rhizogenes]NSZ79048.1 hypothetical protein [Agrobacterium tumefaciens]OAM65840.1 hypothetical protein A8L48_22905 [Rhizobium rhizogenes]CAD0211264.1 hypothetical protein AGRHK599_LOCUS1291 [Rhizobium rhizogenes]